MEGNRYRLARRNQASWKAQAGYEDLRELTPLPVGPVRARDDDGADVEQEDGAPSGRGEAE
eukprot:3967488-Alexandrium_andersonii.AAC.1